MDRMLKTVVNVNTRDPCHAVLVSEDDVDPPAGAQEGGDKQNQGFFHGFTNPHAQIHPFKTFQPLPLPSLFQLCRNFSTYTLVTCLLAAVHRHHSLLHSTSTPTTSSPPHSLTHLRSKCVPQSSSSPPPRPSPSRLLKASPPRSATVSSAILTNPHNTN